MGSALVDFDAEENLTAAFEKLKKRPLMINQVARAIEKCLPREISPLFTPPPTFAEPSSGKESVPILWIELAPGVTPRHLIDEQLKRFSGITKVAVGTRPSVVP